MASFTKSTLSSSNAPAIFVRSGTADLSLNKTSIAGNGVLRGYHSRRDPRRAQFHSGQLFQINRRQPDRPGGAAKLTVGSGSVWNMIATIIVAPPSGDPMRASTVGSHSGGSVGAPGDQHEIGHVAKQQQHKLGQVKGGGRPHPALRQQPCADHHPIRFGKLVLCPLARRMKPCLPLPTSCRNSWS
jgi:hypothetical protein